jgi:hypothetical protein
MTTPASTAEPRKSRWRRLSLAQAGALVGLVGGVVGLVFVFKPGWKPQAPADVGKLTIAKDSVEAGRAPLRRFYARTHLPIGDLTPSILRQRGELIEFHFEATGFKGKTLPIRRELIDVETGDAVPGGTGAFDYSDESVGITLTTNNDARKWFVWSPVPKTTKRYQVTVTIYQPRKGDVDVPLDDFDTKPFRGLAAK